jgi:hypothetical protein
MLTPDQIKSLRPGPELDRAIGEQLFGLRVFVNPMGGLCAEQGGSWALPLYSSTWSGLGLVVEEMERRGYSYTIQSADDDYHYYVEMWKAGADDHWMFGKSLAEATAKAALLALAAERAGRGEG